VLESGWFILGDEVKNFEKEFSRYVGTKYGIGVGSGTDAITLSLMALGIGSGDEVITVSHTSIATASAISITGAKPVFVDVEEDTMLMDINMVKSKITSKTKAIVPVHLYGHPVNLDPLVELSEMRDIPIVEDCAQAHGAEYKGKKVGTFGKLSAFSFYPTKNLGAYGDAGMILTNEEELYQKLLMLRQYGWKERDVSIMKGINSRLDEIQAAILRVKLKYLNEWNQKRRENAKLYKKLLKDTSILTPVEKEYAKHVYHLYVIRSDKRDFLKKSLKMKGVQTQVHYPIPVHKQKSFKTDLKLPVTEKICGEILSLPIHPFLHGDEISFIAECLKCH
jgi:dTDP-4-amino-4,6-dideoxygalactose transaminase